MKWISFILILTFATGQWACNPTPASTNQSAGDNSSGAGKTCADKIIAADAALGKTRNHACEKTTLSITIQQYVDALAALDYSGCPRAFVTAFEQHRSAWLEMMTVTDKYPDLRGEMHNLFDQIEAGSDARDFGIRLKAIWDTWAEVEAALNNKPDPAIARTTSVVPDRFESEIKHFETLDQQNGYCDDCILFTGSSSIRMWATLVKDMQGHSVLNRGFGGATIPEVLHYADRYLWVHSPSTIVFYCGENDIAEGASPDSVYHSLKRFVELMQHKLPQTNLIYISMKPSLNRWSLWPQYQQGEQLIKAFVDHHPTIEYMDSSLSMLGPEGNPKPAIFIEDGLHMNEKGYAGWTKQLKPLLDGK